MSLVDGGEEDAELYVGKQFIYPEMLGEWDFENFERNHLREFIGETEEFLEGEMMSD